MSTNIHRSAAIRYRRFPIHFGVVLSPLLTRRNRTVRLNNTSWPRCIQYERYTEGLESLVPSCWFTILWLHRAQSRHATIRDNNNRKRSTRLTWRVKSNPGPNTNPHGAQTFWASSAKTTVVHRVSRIVSSRIILFRFFFSYVRNSIGTS